MMTSERRARVCRRNREEEGLPRDLDMEKFHRNHHLILRINQIRKKEKREKHFEEQKNKSLDTRLAVLETMKNLTAKEKNYARDFHMKRSHWNIFRAGMEDTMQMKCIEVHEKNCGPVGCWMCKKENIRHQGTECPLLKWSDAMNENANGDLKKYLK